MVSTYFKRVAAVSVMSLVAVTAFLAVGTAAHADNLNGAPDQYEFVLWEHLNYGGGVYDNVFGDSNYTTCCPIRFVNSNVLLNDNASSSANYGTGQRCAYQHSGYAGPSITHTPYGTSGGGGVNWYYSYLGWASDQLSSDSSC